MSSFFIQHLVCSREEIFYFTSFFFFQPNHNKGPLGHIGTALGGGVIGSAIAARSINPVSLKQQKNLMESLHVFVM